MKTIILAFVAILHLQGISSAGETIRVTTWNLEWFPNGSPKELPLPEQAARIEKAAAVIKKLNPDILLLQEVKDYQTCAALVDAISPGSYQIAICSAFKSGRFVGRQQQAILAKIPAMAGWAEDWKSLDKIDPSRGFAFAWFRFGKADLGVYCVHLKSNLVLRGDKQIENALNIRKLESAISQLLSHLDQNKQSGMPELRSVIVGGDFNTNLDQEQFSAETTLKKLIGAGFGNGFDGIPLADRITHPGEHGYPDCIFDYIFTRGLVAGKRQIVASDASDHLPVTCEIRMPN